jgi:ascorbate-specific PTS system EIIC-type component UlaA
MFLNCFHDSKKTQSTALLTLVIGLLVVSCGATWQRAFAPILHLSASQNDFFYGFSIGLGLALEVAALVVLVRSGAAHSNK